MNNDIVPRAAGPAQHESFVLFLNTTQRNVKLYWIDYKGEETYYLTLRPQCASKVNTYSTHAWIFRDQMTGERMQVGHQNEFWPLPYLMRDPRNLSHWIPARKQIAIHFPLRTLRESCLWVAVTKLGVNTKAIDSLVLPRDLKTDLKCIQQAIEKNQS